MCLQMDLDRVESALGEVLAYTEQSIVCLDDNDMVRERLLIAYSHRRRVVAMVMCFEPLL